MKKDLSKVLETGYDFDFNQIFKDSWKLLNSKMGAFLLMTLLLIILQMVFSLIPLINLFSGILSAFLFAGYFSYCRGVMQNRAETSDFFKGFNYAGPIFLYRLVFFLFFVPFIILLVGTMFPMAEFFNLIAENASPQDLAIVIGEQMGQFGFISAIAFLVFLCAAIYLSISYIFVIPLIVDGNMKFWDAMELSRKTVGMKFISIFGYILLIYVGIILGTILTCFVGILFLIPFLYCLVFTAYDSIFQPYESESISDLESFGEIEKDINSESQEGL